MFEINKKLKNNVLSNLTSDMSNLKKALIIYKRLCLSLNYSLEYYLDFETYDEWFQDINNISKIDGENNKDICCFTFNAIFMQLLYDAKICNNSIFKLNKDMLEDNNKYFNLKHSKLRLSIDGKPYHVDSTFGVLDNNDLVLQKIGNNKIIGWEPLDMCLDYSDLYECISELSSEENKIQSLEQQYILQKGSEYKNLSINERHDLFLKLAKQSPEYSILSFHYLLKLKHLLFSEEELSFKTNSPTPCFDLVFVKDKKTYEYKAFAIFQSSINDNNSDTNKPRDLQIHEISVLNKTISPYPTESLKKNIHLGYFTTNHGWKVNIPLLDNISFQGQPQAKNSNNSSKHITPESNLLEHEEVKEDC